ncbi:hypothetical protein TBLA_0A04110 [Henningerozyma blattae CBS 6284]|uniref:Diphthine--ammonia ligase n=1 Tax=Henningerozyma blattae (strain ATCC 34711 / CBS 6284 / DSM 70876 / NBRC 10599 / NRRL Y-10934 / UCD 77-7) TaxID=1071380 RepID=I2GVQ5_HENB6|nr:hypothetical protein TBLA_0A04110 [Tetrapisispora blattae CBS 6284]CCH58207.1 hypothetical protein TBLA_0A04110 [Tetrapisispora blattae CBS 6284]
MKFVALISGGKDSCYNILHCLKNGHELVALANLMPENNSQQELDSFMFQTVGHDIVSMYGKCTGLPLFRQPIKQGGSKNVQLNYTPTSSDEIEDLFILLQNVIKEIPDVKGVSVGAILSSYQRTRVENVCNRLGLVSLAYLWERSQDELMGEMCLMSKDLDDPELDENNCSMDARLIKVAALGLNKTHLGMSLPHMYPILQNLSLKYDVNICGEGGEFETMTLDAPFFRKGKLEITDIEYDTSQSSNGVYNAHLTVAFVEREVSVEQLNLELKKLPVPQTFNSKFQHILEISLKDQPCIPQFLDHPDENCISKSKIFDPMSSHKIENIIYISNLVCTSSVRKTVEEQVIDIFKKLKLCLNEYNVVQSHIISSTLLLKNMADFSKVNTIYNNFFSVSEWGPLPPSRACVGTSLLNSTYLVQLSVIIDSSLDVKQLDNNVWVSNAKNGLHVQGLSYWAPRNIGPYSQVTTSNNDQNKVGYVSGQIALIPPSLELCNEGQYEEAILSLQHFDTIIQTNGVPNILSMMSYITSKDMLPSVTSVWFAYQVDGSSNDDMINKSLKSLIIVQVDELPKSANCEWSGIACKSLDINYSEYSNMTDCESTSFENTSKYELEIPCSSKIVVKDEKERCFVTGFCNSKEELADIVSHLNIPHHITVYYNPAYSTITGNLHNCTITTVNGVYDYKGNEYVFGFQIFM